MTESKYQEAVGIADAIEYLGESGTEGSNTIAIIERPPQTIENFTGTLTLSADPYVGVSAVPFDERAQTILAAHETVPDEWIDIRPEGLLYLSHMKARHILNAAFGFGGWAIVPVGDFKIERDGDKVTMYRQYRLYVSGRFVGETVAAGEYWANNPQQNYADAAEACQSYALNRLAKNFGIAAQCWDKAYGEKWKARFAETYIDKGKTRWRKKSSQGMDAGRVGTTATQDLSVSGLEQVAPTSEKESATQSTNVTPSESAPRSASSKSIHPVAIGDKKWKFGSEECGKVTDSTGRDWTFVGAKALDEARYAINEKKELLITVEVNKKGGKFYYNVTRAEAME